MSEESTTGTENASQATEQAQEATTTESNETQELTAEQYKAMIADLRKENAGHRTKNNELKAKADALDKIEAEKLDATQKAEKAAEELAKERDAAKVEAAIERAARKHGLSDDKDLEVLQGLPADKVEAVAKAIAAGKKTAGKGTTEVGGEQQKRKPTDLTSAVASHYGQ